MGMKSIDAHALSGMRGEVDLVDVRTPAEFAERHIEGARLMPLDLSLIHI